MIIIMNISYMKFLYPMLSYALDNLAEIVFNMYLHTNPCYSLRIRQRLRGGVPATVGVRSVTEVVGGATSKPGQHGTGTT